MPCLCPNCSAPASISPLSLHDALPISYITEVYAREVLDSRGNPTVEVEVFTESGAFGDRKSTRLNSSHVASSYAVYCLKKKRTEASQRLHAVLQMLSQKALQRPQRRTA